jgi:hypothetical protein
MLANPRSWETGASCGYDTAGPGISAMRQPVHGTVHTVAPGILHAIESCFKQQARCRAGEGREGVAAIAAMDQ